MADASITVAWIASGGVVLSAAIQSFNSWRQNNEAEDARNDERAAETARRQADREAEESRLKIENDAATEQAKQRLDAEKQSEQRRVAARFLTASRHCVLILREQLPMGYPTLTREALHELSIALGDVEASMQPDIAEYAVAATNCLSAASPQHGGNEGDLIEAEAQIQAFADAARSG